MTRVELASEVTDDFDRIVAHLERHHVPNAEARIGEIVQALQVLTHSPLIGRPIDEDIRELVIGRGSHGYIAAYHYVEAMDTVLVLAIRSQKEGGYVDRHSPA